VLGAAEGPLLMAKVVAHPFIESVIQQGPTSLEAIQDGSATLVTVPASVGTCSITVHSGLSIAAGEPTISPVIQGSFVLVIVPVTRYAPSGIKSKPPPSCGCDIDIDIDAPLQAEKTLAKPMTIKPFITIGLIICDLCPMRNSPQSLVGEDDGALRISRLSNRPRTCPCSGPVLPNPAAASLAKWAPGGGPGPSLRLANESLCGIL
jgi:hypothetical protein